MSAQDLISRLRAAQKQSDVFMDDLAEVADMLESLQKQRDSLNNLCEFNSSTMDMLVSQRDNLIAAMQKAADEIRKCDYTPARSTLLTSIAKVKGGAG